MFQRRSVLGLLAAAPLVALAGPAFAASPMVFSRDGLAIGGTDPVAYFRDAAPVQGRADFALMWHGATWAFASAENMESFEMNPEAFAPQFGGYCAYALAQGALAPTVPEAWTIYQDRLYLNYSLPVRAEWAVDIPRMLTLATPHWPTILQE